MSEYQEVSVHGDLFSYELGLDLILNYDSHMIEFVYKNRETSKIVQRTIRADAIKFYNSRAVVEIQSVLSCKLDNEPLLMIIVLNVCNNRNIFWYNILTNEFKPCTSRKHSKADISQAYIIPYKFSRTDSAVISVISTRTGQNTLVIARFGNYRPTVYYEEFNVPKDVGGYTTAICIVPADGLPTSRYHKDPQIILGFSQGNILIYSLQPHINVPRSKKLQPLMNISKLVEFPGYPITKLSSARLYSNETIIVAFAQEKPIGNRKYKYSKPYIKLIEIQADDLGIKRQEIIVVPPSDSIIELKLIPIATSVPNSTVQLSVISTDRLSGHYKLNIWRITSDEIIDALSLQMNQSACFDFIMDRSSLRNRLKFSPSGYLLKTPQKIASIILLNNQNKKRGSRRNKGTKQVQRIPKIKQGENSKNEDTEERQVSPMKRVRKLTIIHKTTNDLSRHKEDNSSRRKRSKNNSLPTVVTYDNLSSSEDTDQDEGDTSKVIARASSSLSVVNDDDTVVDTHVKQKDHDDTNETSQPDTQQSQVPEADYQQMHTDDSQMQQYQQISVNRHKLSIQENQLEAQSSPNNTQSIEYEYLAETNSQSAEQSKYVVKQRRSVEIEDFGSAKEDVEPKEIQTDKSTKVDLKPGEKHDYMNKASTDDIDSATIRKDDNDYGTFDIIDENDEFDEFDEYNQAENNECAICNDDDLNLDRSDDRLSIPKSVAETLVILSSDEEEEELRTQEDEEINDIVNHAVFEPLRIGQDQGESSSVVSEDNSPFMDDSLLNQGEIGFVPGGEFYIGTDQAFTTTTTIPETESYLQSSLDYVPVSDDELLRLLAGPVASDANERELDGSNSLPMTLTADSVVNDHSINEMPALSVDFPMSAFPNDTGVPFSSFPQNTVVSPMAEEESLTYSMSNMALDVARMCFKTSEVDMDTLSTEKQDQMGRYCWESNNHRLKLFMMRYSHDHGMSQAVVMLGRSLLHENEKGDLSPKEITECKSLLKHHLFKVHPSVRSGVIINPFSEQSRRDMLQINNSYLKQNIYISSSLHQPEQSESYVEYYGFGCKPF